jgi:hypothetical protein
MYCNAHTYCDAISRRSSEIHVSCHRDIIEQLSEQIYDICIGSVFFIVKATWELTYEKVTQGVGT